ncbi:TPA: hypothetical protein HA351_05450 [Methanosarcinaceae archaeon]|nr:hypothetical protein [Methanosarcinaceae archaeon]
MPCMIYSDTVTEEELAREVLKSMRPYVHDGVEVREHCSILKRYWGLQLHTAVIWWPG